MPTTDGRRVRDGVPYRSGTPQLLTEDDGRALADELGLRLVADLRSPAEGTSEGEGGLAVSDHRRLSVPLVVASTVQEGSPVPRFADQDPLAPHYLAYLDHSQDEIVALVRALAEPQGVRALVYCTVGKDRTGAAMMMVLDAIGVE
ncbi:tyrosine-protein phosphatase [Nocardioides sp. 31GB23]|uniref:tyrosine-protein phosphatase n=1 Tax=Nocardioides sp. 31GB23 TaxID=3156065 RepID=UPI0032AF599D